MDRSAQPVWIDNDKVCNDDLPIPAGGEREDHQCFHNRLNAFMDHCWDGFYTCQQREQRFPTVIYQDPGVTMYDVTYTGTPPEKQEFVFHAAKTTGIAVRIFYANAGSYAVYDKNGNV